ncbi:hypothetical protein [Catenuloplanes indicus]|uniref:hypothetical protein n=1 Tax=Catenuloplanes indicus TaxID=137267 RepID=UPI003522A768
MLSDEAWGRIAGEAMAQIGLARYGDAGAVRWVAVRHGADHIHIVAALVRKDRRTERARRDRWRAQAACRDLGERYGLYRVGAAGRAYRPAGSPRAAPGPPPGPDEYRPGCAAAGGPVRGRRGEYNGGILAPLGLDPANMRRVQRIAAPANASATGVQVDGSSGSANVMRPRSAPARPG